MTTIKKENLDDWKVGLKEKETWPDLKYMFDHSTHCVLLVNDESHTYDQVTSVIKKGIFFAILLYETKSMLQIFIIHLRSYILLIHGRVGGQMGRGQIFPRGEIFKKFSGGDKLSLRNHRGGGWKITWKL